MAGKPRCAGYKRGGLPCSYRVNKKGDRCWRHPEGSDAQIQQEKYIRAVAADPSSKSVNSHHRVSGRWAAIQLAMRDEGFTWTEFVRGLSPRELANGRLKSEDGVWNVETPSWVPREFHQACLREMMRRGTGKYRSSYLRAIRLFTQIIDDEEADLALRMKAAQYVWERVEGKIPERVEVAEVSPWQDALLEAVVSEEQMMQKARETLKAKEEAG